MKHHDQITTCIEVALDEYFRALEGEPATTVYDMVIKAVERPLFEAVLAHTEGNQTRAAEVLGINRNTLRKKLKDHGLVD